MNDPQSGNDVLLDAFPYSPDHPLISVIPEWPRWAYWDGDPPRKFWLSRVGERLYYVTEFSGEIDPYDGRPEVTPRGVHSVALKRLDPAKWGWGGGDHLVWSGERGGSCAAPGGDKGEPAGDPGGGGPVIR
jgi:hypothetical protein